MGDGSWSQRNGESSRKGALEGKKVYGRSPGEQTSGRSQETFEARVLLGVVIPAVASEGSGKMRAEDRL